MSVSPIPEDCDRIIPHITVKGASDAIEFYKKAFGVTVRHALKHPDGRVMHADLRVGDSVIYLNDDFEGGELVFLDDGEVIAPHPGLGYLFQHCQRHEARALRAGVKYCARTDVLYDYAPTSG